MGVDDIAGRRNGLRAEGHEHLVPAHCCCCCCCRSGTPTFGMQSNSRQRSAHSAPRTLCSWRQVSSIWSWPSGAESCRSWRRPSTDCASPHTCLPPKMHPHSPNGSAPIYSQGKSPLRGVSCMLPPNIRSPPRPEPHRPHRSTPASPQSPGQPPCAKHKSPSFCSARASNSFSCSCRRTAIAPLYALHTGASAQLGPSFRFVLSSRHYLSLSKTKYLRPLPHQSAKPGELLVLGLRSRRRVRTTGVNPAGAPRRRRRRSGATGTKRRRVLCRCLRPTPRRALQRLVDRGHRVCYLRHALARSEHRAHGGKGTKRGLHHRGVARDAGGPAPLPRFLSRFLSRFVPGFGHLSWFLHSSFSMNSTCTCREDRFTASILGALLSVDSSLTTRQSPLSPPFPHRNEASPYPSPAPGSQGSVARSPRADSSFRSPRPERCLRSSTAVSASP